MTWSYAGWSQPGAASSSWLLVRVTGVGVPVVIGTVLSISGVVIFGRVPSILDHIWLNDDLESNGSVGP